jgi:dipeptidase E
MQLFLLSVLQGCLPYILENLPQKAEKLKLAFIPNAGDPYENPDFVTKDREDLTKAGFQMLETDLAKLSTDQVKQNLEQSDLIYGAGGNAFYLLYLLQKHQLVAHIQDLVQTQNKIYIGGSAGSIIACPNIEYVKFVDDPKKAPELPNHQGLNLCSQAILPHWGTERYKERFLKAVDYLFAAKQSFLPLTDTQLLHIHGSNQQIIDTRI